MRKVDLRYLAGQRSVQPGGTRVSVQTSKEAGIVFYAVVHKSVAEEFVLIPLADDNERTFSGAGLCYGKLEPVICPVLLDYV